MSKKIGDIQIFRAIAILFVLFQHFSLTPIAMDAFPMKISLPLYLGVQLFFVISGYVVARSFFSGTKVRPIYFYAKRFFRIYPALLVFILLCYFTNFISLSMNLSEGLADLFVIPWDDLFKRSLKLLLGIYINQTDFLNTQGNPLAFGAMWTLSVEFQFYTFVFLLGLVLSLITRNNKKLIENLFLFSFLLLYSYVLISRFMLLFDIPINLFVKNYIISYNFDFVALGFILAMIQKKNWIPEQLATDRETSLFISPLLLAIPVFLGSLSESPLATDKTILQGFSLPIIGFCFCFLIYLSSTSGCFPGEKTLVYRILYWIGDRSYAIYLFHYPFFILIWAGFYVSFPAIFSNMYYYGIAQIILTVLFLTPFVEFIYHSVELPLIEYSHEFIFKKMRT